MGEPYTDADVQRLAPLIAEEHGSDAFGPNPSSGEYAGAEREQYRDEVRVVLDALAADGRLLPDGGDRHVQQRRDYDGGISIGDRWRRTVTTWPDGTTLTGPWTPAEDTDG